MAPAIRKAAPVQPQRTIVQIIPADGWSATYRPDEPESEILVPLVCWALVELRPARTGEAVVVLGMIADGKGTGFADSVPGFTKYAEPTPPR
jgi:hypothetical protein